MAATKQSTHEIGRRDILKVGAVSVGAALIPAAVDASDGAPLVELVRRDYQRRLEQLATRLRQRFESGELHADREEDEEATWEKVEMICTEHFGLHVTVATGNFGETYEGDDAAAYLILAASPHASTIDGGASHPCYEAQEAATWDLIALARSRGWYAPTADEWEDPAIGSSVCPECGDIVNCHEDGCHVHGCTCTMKHTRHVAGLVA